MISGVLKKLRYKPKMRIGVFGAPAAFEAELAAVKELERVQRGAKNLDLVQAFFTRRGQLERELGALGDALGERGILWVCYPKAKALGTDLNRDIVREVVAREGLKTVAIVAIDAVWSALRCKIL